jgi:hypothetical protein
MTSRQGVPGDGGPRPGTSDDLDPEQVRRVLGELQQKLESLPVIEQAKGILMARFHLDAERAFSLLVRWSQAHNVKLRAVSDLLVSAAGDAEALGQRIELLQGHTPQAAGTSASRSAPPVSS